MLCDACKKNEASVHITKVVNGVKQEYNLCDQCAKEVKGINFVDMGNMDFNSPFTFQNILSGIIDYINQSAQPSVNYVPTCKNCGMTYTEFKKHGLMGCSECYENFQTYLVPVIKGVQGNLEHVGKIPNKTGKEILSKRKLLKLKEELQEAITAEEYEKAAQLRDEIRELQKNEQGGAL